MDLDVFDLVQSDVVVSIPWHWDNIVFDPNSSDIFDFVNHPIDGWYWDNIGFDSNSSGILIS